MKRFIMSLTTFVVVLGSMFAVAPLANATLPPYYKCSGYGRTYYTYNYTRMLQYTYAGYNCYNVNGTFVG